MHKIMKAAFPALFHGYDARRVIRQLFVQYVNNNNIH